MKEDEEEIIILTDIHKIKWNERDREGEVNENEIKKLWENTKK